VFVHEQLAIGQVRIELGDVGLGVGDIRGAAEVVTMIEEDVLCAGCVGRDITIPWLGIVRVFRLLPLNGCDNARGVFRTLIMLSSTMNMGLSS